MPLTGEYEPSPSDWARKQAETFERSGGAEANTLRGKPIVLLTSVGARSGKLRKSAADAGGARRRVRGRGLPGRGARSTRSGTTTSSPTAHVELQDGPVRRDYTAREVHRRRDATSGGNEPWRRDPTTPATSSRPTVSSRCSC